MATVASNSLKLLKALYDCVEGNVGEIVSGDDLLRLSGIGKGGSAAINYLIQKRLVDDHSVIGQFHVAINARGIDEIESAIDNPNQAPANIPVPLQLIIQNMHGGIVQQGSNNSPATQYNGPQLDLSALAEHLATLRAALWPTATEPEQQQAVMDIAEAANAAKAGDQGRVVDALKKLGPAGKWVLEKSTAAGIPVATAAIKGVLGLP